MKPLNSLKPTGATSSSGSSASNAGVQGPRFPACPSVQVGAVPGVDLGTEDGLNAFAAQLAGKNFLNGDAPSKADAEVYGALSTLPAEALGFVPEVKRWCDTVGLFLPHVRSSWQ